MSKIVTYQPSAKEKSFLDSVENGKYDRQIIKGLKKFMSNNVPEDMKYFYSID